MSATSSFILVLDDSHNITKTSVNDAVTYLLTNLPANLHLVLTSRVDPLLPISRLRAQGQMIEIRTADLRFTHEEAAKIKKMLWDLT